MLYVAAKIVVHGNSDQLRYSVHEQRAAGLMDFLQYLDRRRAEAVSGRAKKILQPASRRLATQSPLICESPQTRYFGAKFGFDLLRPGIAFDAPLEAG